MGQIFTLLLAGRQLHGKTALLLLNVHAIYRVRIFQHTYLPYEEASCISEDKVA